MLKNTLFRLLSFFLVLVMLQSSPINLFAADEKDEEPNLYGKVFDPDKKDPDKQSPLSDVPVRIVNGQTGESRDTLTNKSGCYEFKKVVPGTYSLLVNNEKIDFTLPDKIKVEQGTDLMACVALQYQNNSLTLVTDKRCKCEGFPLLLLVLGTPLAAGLLLIHQEEEGEEVSASRP